MAKKFKDKRDKAFLRAMGGSIDAEDISITALAKKINVSRPTIHNWRKNPSVITLGYLRILARELHFSDSEVLEIVKYGERRMS
ncbi:MAG: helix-turn-helix domain-containing protein [Christensenellales bacterium]|jgi:transcriptional regulator with XRE-family HTH domain